MAQNFDFILSRLRPELEEMNRIIIRTLHTDNRMMNDVVSRYLEVKGKQIRPILVILSAKMFGAVNDEVLHAGAALEMLHNASLIHDDVVDETDLRRGRPTVNARMGNHFAVLMGDFFVSNALAAGILTGSVSVVKALSDLGKELSLGEVDQICNAREHHFDEESYLAMIGQKTASLFTNCVKMGAEMAGAGPADVKRMMRFGYLLGLCFQIKDDIFDYYDNQKIGKPTGNDLREGKVTLPLLHALAVAPAEEAAAMKEMIARGDLSGEEISRAVEFAKVHRGIDYAYARMRAMQREAQEELAPFPDTEQKRSFLDILEFIIARDN